MNNYTTGPLDLLDLLPREAGALIVLGNGTWGVTIAPDCGARIVSLTHGGRDILRPASSAGLEMGRVYEFGGFPLIPYSGPVFGGGFHYGSEFHRLERNVGEEPSPTHGEGWIRPWIVQSKSDAECRMEFEHLPSRGTFPFRYKSNITYTLSERGLQIKIVLRNQDHRVMPAGIGFHPYFMKHPGTQLRFECCGVWPPDAPENVELGCLPLGEGFDFKNGQDVWPIVFDRCFEGWNGGAEIQHPDGLSIELRAVGALKRLQIYNPWNYPYLCVEPVSNANDGFNRMHHRVACHGVAEIEPGDQIEGSLFVELNNGGAD